MDIASIVYRSADVTIPPRPDIYIDEKAEIAKPKPLPLREPRPVYNLQDRVERDEELHPAFGAEFDEAVKPSKSKHESYNLSGSVFLISKDGRTLDLPIPSDSPNDPLNWDRWKTAGAMLAVGWYSVSALTDVQAVDLMMEAIVNDFPGEVGRPFAPQTLVTAPTLFMGLGCFLWVPLSLALGRRPVLLLAALVHLLATTAAGYSQSFHQLIVFACVLGVCEGLSLSLAFLMVIDMTFIDQRPKAIAALWSVAGFFGTSSLFLVPFLSDNGRDWRLFYHRWLFMSSGALLAAFLLFPETYFKRPTVAFDGMILMQSATEKLTIYEDLEEDSELYRDLPSYPFDTGSQGALRRLGLGRSPSASWKAMGRCYLQMFYCTINPLIFWVLIASACNFAGLTFIASTFAEILDARPYHLSQSLITIVNVCNGTGCLLGYPLVGYGMTKILTTLSKRNRGVREAEHYLLGYAFSVVAGGCSTLLYGLAVHNHWHFSTFYIAYGLNGVSFITLSIGNTLWVTEAFPRWAAPAFAVVSGGCYFLSFTMSFALVPWVSAHGYLLVGMELTVLQMVGGLIALPIAFWGKSVRQKMHGRWANERSGALRPV